ncbi:MAG: tetratricopeptide repeat protein [Planctomycetes bacterium]|nr:tetratricopeptide repeat protein [Planctomycetota bacterium]
MAKNGRAEVLKAMKRYDEALNAYNAVIAAHPQDVAAKNGRAEVLKALERYDEALEGYEAVIAAHPPGVVAKTGSAEVLKPLERFDESVAAKTPPAAQGAPRPAGNQLTFAVHGFVQTGKTSWQMALHAQINDQRGIPDGIQLSVTPSDYQAAFDRNASSSPEGSVLLPPTSGLQSEQTFQFRGRSGSFHRALSAQVTLARIPLDDALSRQTQSIDGLVYFLDPDGDDQGAKVLEGLYNLASKNRLPIAVCLSKIDRFEMRNLPGNAAALLASLRSTAEQPITLELLKRRSEICEKMMPNLYPGRVQQLLNAQYDRVLFFPMTAMGLDQSRRSDTSLRNLTRNFFGALEPLLWLLDMNDYRALK